LALLSARSSPSCGDFFGRIARRSRGRRRGEQEEEHEEEEELSENINQRLNFKRERCLTGRDARDTYPVGESSLFFYIRYTSPDTIFDLAGYKLPVMSFQFN
jgi:hypothetical protein